MIKPRVRKKIPECDRCLLYAHNPYLVCAVHPSGPGGDSCLDFREDPNAEPLELWEPEGARYIDDELVIERTYYNGEEIRQPTHRFTLEEQLCLLDNNYPMFTGFCPQCGHMFQENCDNCGWKDDSVSGRSLVNRS